MGKVALEGGGPSVSTSCPFPTSSLPCSLPTTLKTEEESGKKIQSIHFSPDLAEKNFFFLKKLKKNL